MNCINTLQPAYLKSNIDILYHYGYNFTAVLSIDLDYFLSVSFRKCSVL